MSRPDFLAQIQQYRKEAAQAQTTGLPALRRLVPIALGDTGQSGVVGRFLLSLYNGPAYPFALTDLRILDLDLFNDCLAVLRLDHYPEQEVHCYLPDGNQVFSQLVTMWASRKRSEV